MAIAVVWWLAVAAALSTCRDVLCDQVTWPGCPPQPIILTTLVARVVEPGIFDHKASELILNNCNITSLKKRDFIVYPELQVIELRGNSINFIETGTFDSLVSLNRLYLDGSFADNVLPSNLFRNCHRLSYIALTNLDMSGTPDDLLLGLDNLRILHCDNCSLHEVPSFITRPVFPNMEDLYLLNNKLTRLDDPSAFSNVANVGSLGMGNNTIEYLHEDLFRPFTRIYRVHLDSNKIKVIPEKLFQNISSLSYIDLFDNLIEHIPEKAFIGTKLKTLILTNNRLSYLPENFFSRLQGLSNFSFDGNPLSCGCLNRLLTQVKQLNIVYEDSEFDGQHKNCLIVYNFKCTTYEDLYKEFIIGGE